MTSDPREITGLVNQRVSRILTIAETALPQERYKPFRKLVLDEFGRNGLEQDIYDLFAGHHGKRNG